MKPLSKQQRWQERKRAQGLCIICGEPAVGSDRCLTHLAYAREWQRKERHASRRYTGSLTYRLEAAL